MKKILISIIICLMMLTLNVNAANAKDKINVYFFHGDGCPHCENATKFFDSIKKEYEKYYNLEKYEVWYNEENSNLMEKFRKNTLKKFEARKSILRPFKIFYRILPYVINKKYL